MKVLLVNDQFESGGAARVACIMCNEFKSRGYDIIVVTDTVHYAIEYDLNKEIPLREAVFRSKSRATLSRIASLFKAAKGIRKHLKRERPDVIIAIQSNAFIRTLIANRHLHIPLIVADHTSFSRKMDFINTATRHFFYKYADGISILTNRDERLLGEKYPQKVVIHNPLTWDAIATTSERRKTILAAGRFDIWKIKGFDILLNIWGQIAADFPEWTLEIAGTGSRDSIAAVMDMVRENRVEDRTVLLGQVPDMKTLYSHSGIFALSSRVEGMPMVLLEAMSQGCPCVAFDVGGASSEMLGEGDGVVVQDGDEEGFKKALVSLMINDSMRNSYSKNAIKAVSLFSVDSFMEKWRVLIEKTVYKQI